TSAMRVLHLSVLLVALAVGAQQRLLPGSCGFEQGACGYTSDPAYAPWTVNDEGRFIMADSSFMEETDKAILVSPDLEIFEWSCLRLVYQITGMGSLLVHLRPDSENFDYVLWSADKSSDSWLIANVDLRNISGTYQLLMEAQPSQRPGNSIAIFEIHIIPGYCIECNFEEHHLCGYSNQWNPNVNWYVGARLAQDLQSDLPDDHTMNNEKGHYMYVDSIYVKKFQEVAKLVSPMTTTPMAGCLSFYYQRNQARGNFFSVFTRDPLGHYEEIWRPDVYATSTWKLVQVDIRAYHPLEVVYEVAFNSASGGYVAVDDIAFSPEFCHTETEPTFDPSVANCDFEESLCQYYQEHTGMSVWNRVTVRPNAYRIGDHTTGSGFFLMAHTHFTSGPGYMGRLHAPFLPGNHKYCLRFHYALSGFWKIDNTLSLYIYDENNVAQERIWTVSESSRDVWTEVDITYQKPMSTKIVFVSICRNFWDCGIVALDDVTVTLGDCRITAGPLRPAPGHCYFETGDCGYTQENEKKRDNWIRLRGQTPTSYTGPRGDHTLGVGHFMYIEASHMLPGHSSQLASPELRGSSRLQCLTFFYHMYGSGTGVLSVFLRQADGTKDRLLWQRHGEQSISWMKAMVDYDCFSRHKIIFEAVRGPSIRSDIALDDIVFRKGPCQDPGDSISYSGFSENFNEIEY
uniref:MAM domain-containing protein n=2 Tax=Electrophorus electricus TaxID=8005 RepID=A0A4W4FRJ6_ELEEL